MPYNKLMQMSTDALHLTKSISNNFIEIFLRSNEQGSLSFKDVLREGIVFWQLPKKPPINEEMFVMR